MTRNIETVPSKQMYRYLSLVERKVAEFYHNIDRRRWLNLTCQAGSTSCHIGFDVSNGRALLVQCDGSTM